VQVDRELARGLQALEAPNADVLAELLHQLLALLLFGTPGSRVAAISASELAKATNSSFLATKSVSLFSSTSAPHFGICNLRKLQ